MGHSALFLVLYVFFYANTFVFLLTTSTSAQNALFNNEFVDLITFTQYIACMVVVFLKMC